MCLNVVRMCVNQTKMCSQVYKMSCAQSRSFYTHQVVVRLRAKSMLVVAFAVHRGDVEGTQPPPKGSSITFQKRAAALEKYSPRVTL